MVVIRPGSAEDAAQIAAVQRDGWFAAYEGIIPAEIIDRVTAPDDGARERAGFAPDGTANVLEGLGGVTEVRYHRALNPSLTSRYNELF